MTFVSLSQRVAFVHIPRTGGSSILEALRFVRSETRLGAHLRARDIVPHIGEREFRDLHSIAVVREPVAWFRSTWRYIRQQPLHPLYIEAAIMDGPEFARHAAHLSPPGWRQVDFLTEADGAPLVRHVLRFERLREEWAILAREIGLPTDLPFLNQSRDRPEDDGPMDEVGRSTVETIFAEDAIRLGYPLTPATRAAVEHRWSRLRELARGNWFAEPAALRSMGELLVDAREFDQAEALFRRARQLAPDPGDSARLASCPRRIGEATPAPDDAIAAIRRVISGVAATPLLTAAAHRG